MPSGVTARRGSCYSPWDVPKYELYRIRLGKLRSLALPRRLSTEEEAAGVVVRGLRVREYFLLYGVFHIRGCSGTRGVSRSRAMPSSLGRKTHDEALAGGSSRRSMRVLPSTDERNIFPPSGHPPPSLGTSLDTVSLPSGRGNERTFGHPYCVMVCTTRRAQRVVRRSRGLEVHSTYMVYK